MKLHSRVSRTASTLLFVLAAFVSNAGATERWLVPDTSQCAADLNVNPCYTTLQDAVMNSNSDDIIKIFPGTYVASSVSINKNINIQGIETARTFITANGGTAITISAATSMTIKHITFINAAVGIVDSTNTTNGVSIKNNIFELGSSATAIHALNLSAPKIWNNIFYSNQTAISAATPTVSVLNNIFYGNATAISGVTSTILNNLFFNTPNIGTAIDTATTDVKNIDGIDPSFVDISSADVTKRDFHLKLGSPCIDTGNTLANPDSVDATRADIGTYGGSESDTVPYIVSGVSATAIASTITVTWQPNFSYTVKGYHVHYGTATGNYNGTGATPGGNSPIAVASGVTSTTLGGLATASSPSAPDFTSTEPRDSELILHWSAGSTSGGGATGYKVYYSTASSPTQTSLSPGITTTDAGYPLVSPGPPPTFSFPISGLTNSQYYAVGVTAVAQAQYFISVTAIGTGSTFSVGVSNESRFSAEPSPVSLGSPQESALSNIIVDYPEPLIPYPNLPNTKQGCFIATAAYGSYAEPHVQILRTFRDTVLLSNSWGRAFVGWYYATSPAAAAWLNEHPAYKPLARAVLMPAVGAAYCATNYKAGLIILFVLGCLLVMAWKKSMRRKAGTFILLLLVFGLKPSLANAEAAFLNQPHWSFEIKGGTFTPALSDWATYYGKKDMSDFGISLAYKVRRQIEVGVAAEYLRASGFATNAGHGTLTGNVTNNFFPVDIFVLFRGIVHEEQWLVPYIGGGYTRIYYNEQIEGQDTRKGATSGFHARGGLQFLLDGIDRDAANNMARDYGVEHTYFFIEAKYTKTKVESIDLSGTSFLAGLLFEF